MFVVYSDHKKLKDALSKDSISQETDFSKIMILKGVSPHLQCPLCNNLIHEPRVLACSHTYCLECLEDTVRKTVQFSQFQNFANPAYKPTHHSDSEEDEFQGKIPDTFSPTYTLEAFLGAPLNDELKSNLSQILSPEFTGIEHVPDKRKNRKKMLASGKKQTVTVAENDGSKQEASSGVRDSGGGGASNGKLKKTSGEKVAQAAGKKKAEGLVTNKGDKDSINDNSRDSKETGKTESVGEAEAATDSTSQTLSKKDPNRLLEVLVCPDCGMHTEIPDGNLAFIPYNFFVQHIMDLMTYYSSADPVPLVYCSMCRKDGVEELPQAVARCSTCAAFLCHQCYELHSIDDFTKLHSTLTITERGESSMFSCLTPGSVKVRLCKFHGQRPYIYYCISCSRGICEMCSKRDHKTHLFTRPEDIRSDFVAYIRDLMSRTSQLRRRMEGAVKTAQDLMGGIQLLAATQIEEVLRTQDVLTSTLDMRLSVMMMEAEKAAEGNRTSSSSLSKALESKKNGNGGKKSNS